MKGVDLTGKTFGYLTVLRKGPYKIYATSKQVQWVCKCICGNERIVSTSLLLRKSGAISCGCKNFTGDHANRKSDPKLTSYKAKIKAYKATTRHRAIGKITWDLTEEQAIAFFQGNCYYCGSEPNNTYNVYVTKSGKFTTQAIDWCSSAEIKYNGIDRKDSSLGYTFDNCISCCKTCNYAKNSLSLDEFYEWIEKIALYQGFKK